MYGFLYFLQEIQQWTQESIDHLTASKRIWRMISLVDKIGILAQQKGRSDIIINFHTALKMWFP